LNSRKHKRQRRVDGKNAIDHLPMPVSTPAFRRSV
jgi:hypothetical protein